MFHKIEKHLLEKNLNYLYDIELLNNVWVIILVYRIYTNLKGMWNRLMPIKCEKTYMVNEIVELFKKVALVKYNTLVPWPIQH